MALLNSRPISPTPKAVAPVVLAGRAFLDNVLRMLVAVGLGLFGLGCYWLAAVIWLGSHRFTPDIAALIGLGLGIQLGGLHCVLVLFKSHSQI